jgi:hypothetical protein
MLMRFAITASGMFIKKTGYIFVSHMYGSYLRNGGLLRTLAAILVYLKLLPLPWEIGKCEN